jgi:hypothetical protein
MVALASRNAITREANTWWVLALITLFLGINKETELQTLLVRVGRSVAIHYGWYDVR